MPSGFIGLIIEHLIYMDNTLNLEKPWAEVKEILMEARTDLTEEDLHYNGDDASGLIQRLANKMGRTPEQVKAWIESASHTSGLAS